MANTIRLLVLVPWMITHTPEVLQTRATKVTMEEEEEEIHYVHTASKGL